MRNPGGGAQSTLAESAGATGTVGVDADYCAFRDALYPPYSGLEVLWGERSFRGYYVPVKPTYRI